MNSNRVERCDIYISEKSLKSDIKPHNPSTYLSKNPMKDGFMFVPSHCPELRSHVKSLVWDCCSKHLIVEIYETKDFAAYKWFGTINKRKRESTNSPFVDIEKDAVALIFLDSKDLEVARFKFMNLQLVEHECPLGQVKWDIKSTAFGNNDDPDPLVHEVKIKYEDIKEVKVFREDEPSEIDQEWQDVKLEEI